MRATVLVVEDEKKIRELVRGMMERAGLTVVSTGSGAEALTLLGRVHPDLVVLDLMLPDVPGEEVAREIRVRGGPPVLMLTAKASEGDRIAGLELGADDYVTKPFSPRELVLRAEAVLRRGRVTGSAPGPASFGRGQLVLDDERHQVKVRDVVVELTPTEWGILTTLASVPGRVYSRYELINRIRGYEFEGYERTIDSHVKNLRRKIEEDPARPRIVDTVLGVGYRLGLMAKRRLGRLGSRLALAFVAVAVAAVALLAALTLLATQSQVSSLAANQQRSTVASVATALSQAYRGAGGWEHADLRPAYTVAASAGASLQVLDQSRQVVVPSGFDPSQLMSGMMRGMGGGGMHSGTGGSGQAGTPVQTAVTVDGNRVGTAVVRFPGSGLPLAVQQVQTGLVQTVALGAGLAALLALGVSWFIARRITRPLARLTDAVGAIEAGDRRTRARQAGAPGEIGDLAVAFDRMAGALDREDLLRRNLLADVAHELRTPITVLQASCEQMADGSEPATPARLASLRDESLRLGRLVRDLETLASAEAAGLQMVKAPVDLAEVAAGVADMLGPAFATAEVELASHLEPVQVDADATRLGQIVTNLLTNALKFSLPHGQVALTTAAGDGLARLEVADEGPGIPAGDLPHIFERFWRGRAGRTTSGSGIGLAVVAELVRAHGGQVRADSSPGAGARFTVLLPRA